MSHRRLFFLWQKGRPEELRFSPERWQWVIGNEFPATIRLESVVAAFVPGLPQQCLRPFCAAVLSRDPSGAESELRSRRVGFQKSARRADQPEAASWSPIRRNRFPARAG